MLQNLEDPPRQMLTVLARENLNGLISDLRTHMDAIREFIRYDDEFIDPVRIVFMFYLILLLTFNKSTLRTVRLARFAF